MCRLTYEHREEENGNRDVEDGTGDVKEPVRSHREETKEKEEEEQTATILLHLTEEEEEEEEKRKGQRWCEKMSHNVKKRQIFYLSNTLFYVQTPAKKC